MDETQDWMEDARKALEEGNVDRARRLLRRVVHTDSSNYRAWLWLAGVTDAPAASLQYVRRAQAIAGDDPRVIEALSWAESRLGEKTGAERVVAVKPQPQKRPDAVLLPDSSEYDDEQSVQTLRSWVQRVGLALLIAAAVILIAFLVMQWQSGPTAEAAGLPVVRIVQPQPAARLIQPVAAKTPVAEQPQMGLPPKNAIARQQPLAKWTPTPSPTPLPPTPTPTSVAFNSGASFNEFRWIDVDLTRQMLTAYERGVAVYSTHVSSGLSATPTVTGQYRIYLRLETQNMSGYHLGYDYYLPNVPYVQYFHGNYALHGAYWHNNFGIPQSHGCVNIEPSAAEWLFNFAEIGTLVYVHY